MCCVTRTHKALVECSTASQALSMLPRAVVVELVQLISRPRVCIRHACAHLHAHVVQVTADDGVHLYGSTLLYCASITLCTTH